MQNLVLLATALLACRPVPQDTGHPTCAEGRHWDGSGCVLDDSDADTDADADTDTDTDADTDADAPTWYLGDVVESLVYVGWDQPADTTARVEWSFEDGVWEQGPDRVLAALVGKELLRRGIARGHEPLDQERQDHEPRRHQHEGEDDREVL